MNPLFAFAKDFASGASLSKDRLASDLRKSLPVSAAVATMVMAMVDTSSAQPSNLDQPRSEEPVQIAVSASQLAVSLTDMGRILADAVILSERNTALLESSPKVVAKNNPSLVRREQDASDTDATNEPVPTSPPPVSEFFVSISESTGFTGNEEGWEIDDARAGRDGTLLLSHPDAGSFLGQFDCEKAFYSIPIPAGYNADEVAPLLKELAEIPLDRKIAVPFGDREIFMTERVIRKAALYRNLFRMGPSQDGPGLP